MDPSERPEDRLMKLLLRLRDLPFRAPPFADGKLTLPQIALLNRVARSPGCGVLDIARSLRLTPPTVSVGVRRLARAGLLEWRRDAEDRRVKHLYLTEEGNALMSRVRQHRLEALGHFLSGLNPQEQEQLLALLERAIEAAESGLRQGDG